ncbi:MAG: hypothetical protein CVV33_00355 [Methanomicrobiales archaeon HGW-Methanomicrobiales-4]|nr:MAG: hypothetical protein CVV33_00355 [Methanomicrobiales archaeon HGW-Methanomicrobiales-4]
MISVLYVDDEPEFLDIGKIFLEKSGKLKVDTFLSADIAVKILPFSQYDAIVSDYQMPGMDGLAFLSEVRIIQPDIPFIVYTGQGREEVAIQALNQGADFYLLKGGSPKIQFGEIENFILNLSAREHQKDKIISEKRKAEEALSLLQTLYEYAPFGFAFIDQDMVFIHVNKALADMSGRPRGDLLGRRVKEAAPHLWTLCGDQIHGVLQAGDPILNFEVNGNIPSDPGGIRNWIMNFYPVRRRDEDLFGIGLLIIDNTSRKVVEQALIVSEERYRTLAESAEDAIFILGREEKLIYINSYGSHLLARNINDLIGRTISDSGSMVEDLIHSDGIRSVFSTGLKCSYDAEIRTSDWQRWIEVLLIPMPGYNNPSGQVLGIGRDVTRRKYAESGLLNANRKLNLLSSITRHDIINQISLLFIYLDNLKAYTESDPDGQHIYSQIQQSIHTIHQQIEFTREYQEIGVATPVWQNLHNMIQRSAQSLPINNIKIEESETDYEIYADSLFEKVVYNLIENAIRYGDKITIIRWIIDRSDRIITLIIEDDGIGIPVEDKEEIFSFGFGQHTGFGLFMVQEILSITNMTIRETGVPGEGARFEIIIPQEYLRPYYEDI